MRNLYKTHRFYFSSVLFFLGKNDIIKDFAFYWRDGGSISCEWDVDLRGLITGHRLLIAHQLLLKRYDEVETLITSLVIPVYMYYVYVSIRMCSEERK